MWYRIANLPLILHIRCIWKKHSRTLVGKNTWHLCHVTLDPSSRSTAAVPRRWFSGWWLSEEERGFVAGWAKLQTWSDVVPRNSRNTTVPNDLQIVSNYQSQSVWSKVQASVRSNWSWLAAASRCFWTSIAPRSWPSTRRHQERLDIMFGVLARTYQIYQVQARYLISKNSE